MGEQRVKTPKNKKQLQTFVKYLLTDISALERMLDDGLFEIDKTRIGAEQELCLVDKNWKPAPLADEVLAQTNNELFTTELAKFNLECNLDPLEFKGKCLSEMEQQINVLLKEIRVAAQKEGADIILTGILPTIRQFDLGMDNVTPRERYYALIQAINKLRGNIFELRVRGIDEMHLKAESPLLEACNTGFQVHLQVRPDDFVKMYNIAQALAGPTMAIATNSPMLFGKRLWKETRVALFQQSVDTRSATDRLRDTSPRVTFGNDWLKKSILEIYKEDIVRYRVILHSEVTENVFDMIDSGIVPELMALKVHNSTVYRWNRPCYGISGNKPHLRIENRILPAGPTVPDEMANAAFWLGLMNGMNDQIDDVRDKLDFDHAKNNFLSASRLGLDTKLQWFNRKSIAASQLIEDELLPLAEHGLKLAKVDKNDISKYLGIIEERVTTGKTGSWWMLNSYQDLVKQTTKDEVIAALTSATAMKQREGEPVHKWDLATLDDLSDWEPASMLVEEFMTTDLFTVQEDDIIELVSEIMNWQRIRYVAVENNKGKLVGLITSRGLLTYLTEVKKGKKTDTPADIMISTPLTTSPSTTVFNAMSTMSKYNIGCLPVVREDRLVGLITEQNFLNITKSLLKRISKEKK